MDATALPSTMTAVQQDRYGPPAQVLALREVDVPTVGPGDVLVQVGAAGVNPADAFLTAGRPAVLRLAMGPRRPKPATRGQDVAGTVVAVGADVTTLRVGDAVFGQGAFSQTTGSYAQYVRLPHTVLAPKPARLSFEQAAAIPMAGLTAQQALRVGGLRAGQRLLVVGASGGVGHAAVQLAVALGAEVTGVCSTRNVELVRSLGAAHVVDYTREDVRERTERFDVILDNVADVPLRHLRRLLTPRGTLLTNSGHGGRVLGPVPRMIRATVMSLVVPQTVRSFSFTPSTADLLALTEVIDRGALTPVVERTYPLADTVAAIEHVAGGHVAGKVVIVP